MKVLVVGSASPDCTVRVTLMVRLAPLARGCEKLKPPALMLVTNGFTPAAPGCWST